MRRYAGQIARRHPRLLWGALSLHGLAALTALAAPRLIGDLVQAVETGTTAGPRRQHHALLAGFLLAQTVLTRFARYVSQVLGEQVLAQLREDFVGNALALPVGVVESAGSGDLLTRTGRDVDQLGWSVRWAMPEWTIAAVTAVLTFAAALSVGWWVALPCLLGLPPLVIGLRWYLARAKAGYLRESASYSAINATLTETVEGARTVEALGLAEERITAIDEDIKESYAAERYTLYLRTVFFPSMEIAYLIPTVTTLLFGGYLYTQGQVSLGDVTAATLYVQMLDRPGRPDRLDPRRAAARCRLPGPLARRGAGARRPRGQWRRARRRAARRLRRALLLRRGPRRPARHRPLPSGSANGSRWSGRPARASRPSAGCSRASTRRAPARSPWAASDWSSCRWATCAATSPWSPRSTTSSSARCARTSPWPPLPEPVTTRSSPRSQPSMPWSGSTRCPRVSTPWSARVADGTTDAQAQQIALARLVLADPHTLVLDEATSLIDPRAARHLERSLAAVLEGRTVIAIAHRLFSAHDADRVAVVENGVISELGSHDELVAAGGSYAALWDSWNGKH